MAGGRGDEVRGAGDVDGPAGGTAVGFRGVDFRVGGGVDDRRGLAPGVAGHGVGVGEVQFGVAEEGGVGQEAAQRLAELPVGPGDHGPGPGHGDDLVEWRVGEVCLGDGGSLEGEGPGDGGVVEVGEGVLGFRVGRPVLVDQVRVAGAVGECLVGVADAAGGEHGGLGADLAGHDRAERVTLAQVHPGAEHAPGGDGDQFVPGFGVDAAGDAGLGVEAHVLLHRAEVRQPECGHLRALPVLLEPAPRVPVQGEGEDQQAGDRGGRHGELGHHCPFAAYFASTAAFNGRHHASFARYQSMVACNP